MKMSGSARPRNAGIIVWRDPWDPAGWEVTEPWISSRGRLRLLRSLHVIETG